MKFRPAWACPVALGIVCATAGAAPNPLKEAYFGETHVHTSWSFDAFILRTAVESSSML